MSKKLVMTCLLMFVMPKLFAQDYIDLMAYQRGAQQAQDDAYRRQYMERELRQSQLEQSQYQQQLLIQRQLQKSHFEAIQAQAQAEKAQILLQKANAARAQLKTQGYSVRMQIGADGYSRYVEDIDGAENWTTNATFASILDKKRLAVFKLVRLNRKNEYVINEKLVAATCNDKTTYLHELTQSDTGEMQLSNGYAVIGDLLVAAKNACVTAVIHKSKG
jgi:hypothetical protein